MRKIVVTGGSRGLGLATARRLVEDGFEVIAIARRTTDELDTAIRQATLDRPRLHFLPFDLGAVDDIPGLAKIIRAEHGHIYGLVNNAAIGTSGMLSNAKIEQIRRQVDLNITSPIALTKHMVRSMIAGGGGRIVNISSIVATTGYSGLSVYSASKAAMIGFTKSLAREVGPLGINVNAVAPGFVDTDMTGEMGEDHKATIARRSALKRMPEAIDIANAVAFLVGQMSNNITGTVLTVDAGNTA